MRVADNGVCQKGEVVRKFTVAKNDFEKTSRLGELLLLSLTNLFYLLQCIILIFPLPLQSSSTLCQTGQELVVADLQMDRY